MIRKGSRIPRKIIKDGRTVHLLLKGSRVIYVSPAAAKAATKGWLDANVKTTATVAEDTFGRWFEVQVDLPDTFTGSASTGWTDGTITLGLHWSDNLTSWLGATTGWIDSPDNPSLTLPGGRTRFYARYDTSAIIRFDALIDQRLTTSRHGKSITQIRVFDVPVPGLSYPYAMPADAARLQTDLRAAGYPSATVTTTTAAWSAQIKNYAFTTMLFKATWSGDDIVSLSTAFGASVTLPHFPYTMPGDEAQLEADLIAAGYTYAQVTLNRDEWEIFLPDLLTTGSERSFDLDITPGDPFQIWDWLRNPNGVNHQTLLSGLAENIRISGAVKDESPRSFARLGFNLG